MVVRPRSLLRTWGLHFPRVGMLPSPLSYQPLHPQPHPPVRRWRKEGRYDEGSELYPNLNLGYERFQLLGEHGTRICSGWDMPLYVRSTTPRRSGNIGSSGGA